MSALAHTHTHAHTYTRTHTCVLPRLVHKEDGLGGALLATAGIGVLVAHVRNVLHIRLLGIGAENLPVEPSVLELDLNKEKKDMPVK